jgi:hypothetical protein
MWEIGILVIGNCRGGGLLWDKLSDQTKLAVEEMLEYGPTASSIMPFPITPTKPAK